jgi:cytochrome c peroxidase
MRSSRVKKRAGVAAAVGLGALVLAWGVVVAQGGKKDPLHGAAPMDKQQQELDKLLAGRDVNRPARIDPAIYKAVTPEDNELTPERIALGRKLYFETALSSDGSVSCATCHDVTRSFTDLRQVSEGVKDQLGKRNAPTTMNAALLHVQFLDGREPTLEAQAGQPILNPVEMGMADKEAAIAALKKKPEYGELFQKAYGREVNYADLERAIAAFERTLVFLDAPFDRFLGGDEGAISEAAKAGWKLFNGKGRCMSCHPISLSNPLGTDNRMHNIGVSAHKQDFEKLARQALELLKEDPSAEKLDELAVGTDLSELGRFMVTKNYGEIGAFRTSQLRNVSITPPYMHDGSLQTLWDVMDHYNKGGEENPYLDGSMEGLALTEEEIDQVVAFLFTLTDRRFDSQNKTELQRQREQSKNKRPFRDNDRAFRKVLANEQAVMGGK